MTNETPIQSSVNDLIEKLIQSDGQREALKTISRMAGYESPPPTIHEFINDSEFLGEMLGFDSESGHDRLFPYWKSALYELFPNPFYSSFREIICTGSIGTGKSTFSMTGAVYDLCKLLHVADPHSKYGLIKSDRIVLALVNATLDLASSVLLGQMNEWFRSSPFFRRQLNIAANRRTMFPKMIDVVSGSRNSQFLGQAVYATILSEINFHDKVYHQAADTYNGLRQRLESRFPRNSPGRIWVDSSKSDSGSFVEDFLLKNRTPEDLGALYIIDKPRWEILPDWKLKLSGKTFKVFVGSQTRDPFIIERPEQIIGVDEAHILDVPDIYESNFRLDINKSLQDIAGVSTQAAYRFISSAEKIESSFTHENPVFREVVSVDMYDQSDKLINYIDYSKIKADTRPRFMHIDLGLVNDKTGIACTRLDGIITVERFDAIANKNITINEPVYWTDFVIAIESKPGQEVPIYKIKNMIIDLRARGYKIICVSTDGYQSTNLRQDLEVNSINAKLISVDRSIDAYVELKNAILSGRCHLPRHPILNKEIREIEYHQGKADHPDRGSKDIADAVAGSIYSAKMGITDYRANTTSEDIINAIAGETRPRNVYEELIGHRVDD
jgi:hypothetical protein